MILEDNKIIVKDDGVGISKQDQERVFERFYRADKSRSNLVEGTGLGLAIVKHTAVKYGGEITLLSEVGYGTDIKIDFAKKKKA
jgi:signal transduction histidine kinase